MHDMSQPELLPKDFEGGFLKALLHDARANTIVIGAAALVPLLAMVGGAVDASRFYMAEARMQAACDAGALAARRAMADDQFTNEHKSIGENFFDQNFGEGLFGMENQQRAFVGTESGEVNGTASGTMPTSLMGMFGYGEFDLAVNCTADINISNTDIMFVIDVTGSMAWQPNGANCGSSGGFWIECSGSRMAGLREAVMTFYDTVEESTSPAAQVRYGMVPYASNVNVGGAIVNSNPSWMASDAVFQSRWAKFKDGGEWVQVSVNVIDIDLDDDEDYIGLTRDTVYVSNQSQCDARRPDDFDDMIRTDLGTHQGQDSQRIEGNQRFTRYDDDDETIWRGEGYADFRSWDGRCRYGWYVYETSGDVTFEIVEELEGGGAEFDEWVYAEIDTANPPGGTNPSGSPDGWEAVNLTTLYDSTRTVEVPIGNDGSMTTLSWDGCIEEADTVATTVFDPIPTNALDMNINLVPSTQAEQWKPVLRDLAWERRSSGGDRVLRDVESSERSSQPRPNYSCPEPAFSLTDITREDMRNFVDSLRPDGSTYHDIGMLWGARFISPRGIFSADNAAAPNGDAIARHIVFMTDGELAPNTSSYGTYGVEWWSRRVSGDANNTTLFNAHEARFQAACRLARQENISVWVVAFGTDLSQNLIDCASPGRAFAADDSTQLASAFREIAQRIAALRLTQ
jgi:hypothetical protein